MRNLKNGSRQTPNQRLPTQPQKRKPPMGKAKEGHEKGVGPYAGNDVKLRQIPHPGWETTDISKKVDPSWKRTDGFSAKLDKAE
jgi:hypothetical protein